jgi:hypothetical protein
MPDTSNPDAKSGDALEPLRRDPEHVRNIIKRVLKLEQERLYQRQPHLNDDVIRIIKEEVK